MSDWTIETLKEYQDLRISAFEEKVKLQFELNQVAIDKAELLMRLKNESMNEWRDQHKDIIATRASKDEVRLLSRMVYIGVGIIIALEFLLKFIGR